VDNAWDACTARAYTNPAGAGASQASFAVREVRTLGIRPISPSDIVPDQDSIEDMRKRRDEIVQPAEPNPPRTMVVASVGGLEGQGVVNAVAWREVGRAGCENNASRYTANWSLESHMNTVSYCSLN